MIERDYYNLPFLADRWGCSTHDLLHLGIQRRIQLCVNVFCMAISTGRTRLEGFHGAGQNAASFEDGGVDPDTDMPDGIYEVTPETLRSLRAIA